MKSGSLGERRGRRIKKDLAFFVFFVSCVTTFPVFVACAADPYAGDAEPLIVHVESLAPAIHGPRVTGTTPGRPFLFLIPATGEPPLSHTASNLPPGLALDEATGIISGAVQAAGKYMVTLEVQNGRGRATRDLAIVAGDHMLALTPPMGWNSWNVWWRHPDDAKIRDAADWMIKSGLAAHGYQYINVDDCWQGERDAGGVLHTNDRFPDMAALADYVHAKGLRFGVYSSPGQETCAGYAGSLGFEAQDARMFAEWGADYLKYDWCSYRVASFNLEEAQKPFRIMAEALETCGRDIVYSIAQGGIADVGKWAPAFHINLWRTAADIRDTWARMSENGFSQAGREGDAGPGHWIDPDMLVVGHVNWSNDPPHPSRLTPAEQVTHLSLWALLAAPLLIGCDLSKIDPFTLDLLTNDEMIDINQDPLGRAASRVAQCNTIVPMAKWLEGTFAEGLVKRKPQAWGDVWARPLSDGTLAVGLFNRGDVRGVIAATWDVLGLEGPQPVRDVWRHRDLGDYDGAFSAMLPPHGAALLKIGRPVLK